MIIRLKYVFIIVILLIKIRQQEIVLNKIHISCVGLSLGKLKLNSAPQKFVTAAAVG